MDGDIPNDEDTRSESERKTGVKTEASCVMIVVRKVTLNLEVVGDHLGRNRVVCIAVLHKCRLGEVRVVEVELSVKWANVLSSIIEAKQNSGDQSREKAG